MLYRARCFVFEAEVRTCAVAALFSSSLWRYSAWRFLAPVLPFWDSTYRCFEQPGQYFRLTFHFLQESYEHRLIFLRYLLAQSILIVSSAQEETWVCLSKRSSSSSGVASKRAFYPIWPKSTNGASPPRAARAGSRCFSNFSSRSSTLAIR